VWNLDLAGFNLDLASGNNSGWTTTVSDQHSTNTVTSTGAGIGNVFARGLFLAGWNSISLLEVKGANTRFTIQTGTGDRVIQGTNRNSTAFDPGAWFKVSGGSMVTNKDAGYLVGSAAGTHGGIYLTDAGTVHYATNGATLYLGGYNAQASYAHNVASIGDLIITNGAKWIMGQSSSALTMGREFGTIGNLKITGSGSAFTNRADNGTARNFLGGKGQATILIENGGSMGTPEGSYIGRGNVGGGAFDATAKTVMTIKDAGSTYVSGYWGAQIGSQGTGLVYVANGGKFTANGAGDGARLGMGVDVSYTGNGTNYAAYGLLSVSNATSSAVVKDLRIGDKGSGKVEVMDGAVLTVTGATTASDIIMGRGNLTISDASATAAGDLITSGTNSLVFELGSRGHGLYYLTLTGDLLLGTAGADVTTLTITTAGDYVSEGLGSTVKLMDYNVKSGVFANIGDGGTFTTAGDEFQLTYGAGETFLTVIPEPASVLLMVSGLVAAWKLRRRA
jgi:hypothetical protein